MYSRRIGLVLCLALALAIVSASCSPAEVNPFQIGQTVYPSEIYGGKHTKAELELAQEGARVLDITETLVRVEYADGSVDFLHNEYFVPGDVALDEDWLLGNPFAVGQEVCAVPGSVREPFPDRAAITGIDGERLYLAGYQYPVNWTHFQECPNGEKSILLASESRREGLPFKVRMEVIDDGASKDSVMRISNDDLVTHFVVVPADILTFYLALLENESVTMSKRTLYREAIQEFLDDVNWIAIQD